jgi:hypothetical protein
LCCSAQPIFSDATSTLPPPPTKQCKHCRHFAVWTVKRTAQLCKCSPLSKELTGLQEMKVYSFYMVVIFVMSSETVLVYAPKMSQSTFYWNSFLSVFYSNSIQHVYFLLIIQIFYTEILSNYAFRGGQLDSCYKQMLP